MDVHKENILFTLVRNSQRVGKTIRQVAIDLAKNSLQVMKDLCKP